jgi:hypothetical protein
MPHAVSTPKGTLRAQGLVHWILERLLIESQLHRAEIERKP